jgi:hypothetical protein
MTGPPSRSLQPDFGNRLIESLDQVGIPAKARQAYVASLTLRAAQTVSRWLDPKRPGLPDLESCVRLCEGLGRSSDWLLGLSQHALANVLPGVEVSATEVSWALEVFQAMRGETSGCDVMRMHGDEMAPSIRDGDLMFVERSAGRILGNGIYALELDGRTVVRRVEAALGSGLIFKCEQAGYRDQVLKDAAAARRLGLRVIGKVQGAVCVTRFWHQ